MTKDNVSIIASTNQSSNIVVGVLFGGRSTEHEISLRSALYILKNMPPKYNILPIGISREGEFYSLISQFNSKNFATSTIEDLRAIVAGKVPKGLKSAKNIKSMFYPIPQQFLPARLLISKFRNLNQAVSCVFPVLHGTNGEDGRLQSLFELADIPYVGCDRVASVIAMDKDIQKRLARDAGIPIANYTVVEQVELDEDINKAFERIEKHIGYPCFVKPNSLGSAIGAGKALNRTELKDKLFKALAFDSKAIVEELIHGTEIECGFLGTGYAPRITTPGEIETEDFYSYEEKYSSSSKAALFVPARLQESQMQHIKSLGKKIARALNLRGFARIDFWNIKGKEKFIFNEANTIPGLTSISMFPKLWEFEGVGAEIWIDELIKSALQYK